MSCLNQHASRRSQTPCLSPRQQGGCARCAIGGSTRPACFGLDLADQEESGFAYDYSIYQVEYSRNLLFHSGARMQRAFD